MPQPSILLVEDNPDEVDLMREALSGAGKPSAPLVLQVAGSVDEAWELLSAQSDGELPALVITDHHLPDGCGQVLIARLRACPVRSRLPVVMVSGDAHRPGDLSPSTLWFAKPDTWSGWRTLANELVGRIIVH